MKVSDYKALYTSEVQEIMQALENGIIELEGGENCAACIEELFRNAHNLKGMSGAMGYDLVEKAGHVLENVLDRCRNSEISISSAETDLMLRVVDLIRELVGCAIDEAESAEQEEILGNIIVLLSPLSARVSEPDGKRINRPQRKKDTGEERSGPEKQGVDCPGKNESTGNDGYDENRVEQGGKYREGSSEGDLEETQEKSHPQVTATKVRLESLDRLMDLVGELIISRIRIGGIAQELGNKLLIEELVSSGRLVSEIQKEVMEARLVPVGDVFQRFNRIVRDISRDMDKKVDLEIVGSEIGLDRTVLESMVDPLVHLIRNAMDHGIESPEERVSSGKSAEGKIILSAKREKNFVILEVIDDGAGIDISRVMEEQVSSGSIAGGKKFGLSEDELCKILTTPGFSTSKEVGRFSGRGIGMNVVKKKVDSLGGSMRIVSKPGFGTKVSLQLPINLSIIKALLFYVGKEIHAIPIEYVRETSRVESGSFKSVRGRDVLSTKEGVIPIVKPWELFNLSPEQDDNRFIKVIVVDTGWGSAGLVVNRILGQQDVVIKGLPAMIRGIGGITGATILGSGRIAFIWDPRILFESRCNNVSDTETVVLAN